MAKILGQIIWDLKGQEHKANHIAKKNHMVKEDGEKEEEDMKMDK